MSTAVFGAHEFTARSGRTVKLGEDGSLLFGKGDGYLSPATAFDGAEYFQAERDFELGRWRWPENPEWVAIEGDRDVNGRTVVVANERTFDRFHFNQRVMTTPADASAAHKAAGAFFEAHPERKPWHDAKDGEVWVLTHVKGEVSAFVVDGKRFESGPWSIPQDAPGITAGRRIWPVDETVTAETPAAVSSQAGLASIRGGL